MAVPVAAEKIFSIGPLPVTNSLLTGWVVVGLFVLFAATLSRGWKLVPRGLQNAFEAFVEFALGFMDQVTHDRARSRRFLPIVGTLFPLILVSNWMGLIPGFGTFGLWTTTAEGTKELVPFFRAATSDLNLTLAMGLTAVVVSHVFGMLTLGFFAHWNKFIQLGHVFHGIGKMAKMKPGAAAMHFFTMVVEFGVGLIELMSEVAKVISLSLRLFGNIFAGEVLLSVLSSLVSFLLPTPFMFMELIVGVVQALVFSMLTLVYLTLATEKPHGSEEKHEEDAVGESHGTGEMHKARAPA
jgi:F-type H+-transporting ATPase subunit a